MPTREATASAGGLRVACHQIRLHAALPQIGKRRARIGLRLVLEREPADVKAVHDDARPDEHLVTVHDAAHALAHERLEILHLDRRIRFKRGGVIGHRPRKGVLASALKRRRHAKVLGRDIAGDHPRRADGDGARLVEHDGAELAQTLEDLAVFDENPIWAPLPMPTMSAVGVASPKAQGHATTMTAMAGSSACLTRSASPSADTRKNHAQNVMAAMARMAGTKTAAILSATRCTGAFEPWASSTARTMRESVESEPTRRARTAKDPVAFNVPPVTASPAP